MKNAIPLIESHNKGGPTMKCQLCKEQPATITVAKGNKDYDICKACLNEQREKDRKKNKDFSFSVRCCWKEGM